MQDGGVPGWRQVHGGSTADFRVKRWMVVTNGERMNWLQRFERHKVGYSYLALALYLLLNNSINATSVWMEHNRQPGNLLPLWEPFLWEYSSMLATLLLSPLLYWWFDRHPLRLTQLRVLLLAHVLGSVLFSLAHTGLMVACRELVYGLLGQGYDFGPWLRELIYEYRKDAWGYLFFLGLYQLLQFVYHRLTGDATLISGDDELSNQPAQITDAQLTPTPIIPASNAPQHFLVKKLDREFLVAISDIEWLEACGNYVNLHSKGRIYPLRATLAQTMAQLEIQAGEQRRADPATAERDRGRLRDQLRRQPPAYRPSELSTQRRWRTGAEKRPATGIVEAL